MSKWPWTFRNNVLPNKTEVMVDPCHYPKEIFAVFFLNSQSIFLKMTSEQCATSFYLNSILMQLRNIYFMWGNIFWKCQTRPPENISFQAIFENVQNFQDYIAPQGYLDDIAHLSYHTLTWPGSKSPSAVAVHHLPAFFYNFVLFCWLWEALT